MDRPSGFSTDPLTDMLAIGAITSRSARIWIRSQLPGSIRLRYWPAAEPGNLEQLVIDGGTQASDQTVCATIPAADHAPLRVSTRYEPPYTRNPYTELNLGILELKRNSVGRYGTRTSIYGHRGALPQCIFRTGWHEPPT